MNVCALGRNPREGPVRLWAARWPLFGGGTVGSIEATALDASNRSRGPGRLAAGDRRVLFTGGGPRRLYSPAKQAAMAADFFWTFPLAFQSCVVPWLTMGIRIAVIGLLASCPICSTETGSL